MNSKFGKANALVLGLTLALGVSAGGLAIAHSDAVMSADSEQPVTDTWITTKVKADLATTEDVKSMDISVTTVNGVVELTGTQESQMAVNKAIATAKNIEGVTRVDSAGLKVAATSPKDYEGSVSTAKGSDGNDSDQPVTDTWITAKVKADLAITDDVTSMDISVNTVNGVVELTGTQQTAMAIDKAVAAAKSIKGVTRVDASGLKVAAMSSKDYDGESSDQPVSDAWITTKVKAELAATDDVKSMDVSVSTVDGKVTLIGVLDSKSAVDRAVAATRSVKGVRSVDSSSLKVR